MVPTFRTLALAAALVPAAFAASSQGFDPMAPRGGAGGFNPLLPGGAAPAAPTPAETDVTLNPELGNLPDTPGVEETYYLCSACHSMAIVTQQNLTDARWDYTWTWMVEQQGMPEMDDETRELILSYLKRHFSAER